MKKYKFLICTLVFVFVICIVVKLYDKTDYELTEMDISFEYEMLPDYRTYDSYDEEVKIYLIKNLNNNCYGFINANGEVVIEPKYKATLGFHNGLAAVNDGEKWFYIDSLGNIIIDNIYGMDITKLENFYDKMAPLGINENDGNYLVNSNGDILLEPTEGTYFYSNYDVGKGIVNVFDEKEYLKTINTKDDELVEIDYPLYLLNEDGICFYKSTHKGDTANLDDNKAFNSDFYPYSGNYFGIYDYKNKAEITDTLFKSVSRFDEDGLSVVTLIENEEVCIINTKGEIVTNLSEKLSLNNDDILNASEIKDKKVIISIGETFEDSKTLLVDTKGNLISEKYKIVGTYNNGLAQIEKEGKYGYINEKGKVVLDPIYDFVGRVYDGKSLVVNDGIM